ncbi:adenylate/guanylate cyclase domain-containing protein [Corynebacterium uberis]|uniref:adenylate/guanylate cyclase domain-containing protein n=1 Tax=Corynebacterium TaxID=1716 RepID=UPI001D0ADB06|nr:MULTISPECIES: adenylate/guanylate cyclase domain-containing protein [Corynebacterium]MCZ9309969.1 adenylate/guanylate cyclase domain-containing protein [Corynebacterium sp. c6VSa_13]UDL73112.1 adenylate/guanylate cyclase domain-containing protein [Corynebacterium uberis]UDL76011.1 adenylate/guanylate cyclase domain-containing protein [Corynebacterium uberis]UDL78223.1 adenylate/guanylate cyclase domain-containing protein [Corynebacterium uberis]UDL82641.1 adenylate/guanylate cyclase domain-
MSRLVRAVRWLWSTAWPLYAALVLGSNVLGAVAVMLFIRFLLPLPALDHPDGFAHRYSYLAVVGVSYLVFAVVVGAAATLAVFRPVLDWQRNPDAHDPNMVRNLVLRMPVYQAAVSAAVWGIGIIIATTVAAAESSSLALVVGVTFALAAAVMVLLTYLEAERLVRPVAARALARRFEDSTLEPPIRSRLRLTWLMSTALPSVGVLLLIAGQRAGYFLDDVAALLPAIVALTVAALITGYVGTTLSIMSVVDPILELQDAINRVRRGDSHAEVDIYDGSEIGVLQAGFNEMLRGLRERQRVRDLFGRYVGAEVARRALEEKPTLGGEDRKVAVLFVDVIGSTTFAVNHTPEEVVGALNSFFEHVVEAVHRNKGIINKFQGDAALAVFGAPLPLADATSLALAAARELRDELAGMELQAGIGVAAGHVVAGHIGGHDRFEYTVIGDAVNQAARLTELAKDTPGGVLTSAATLRGANEAEQARWTVLKSVELRGRREMTQLARPIRETLADRSVRRD